jgi:hypothetical protein
MLGCGTMEDITKFLRHSLPYTYQKIGEEKSFFIAVENSPRNRNGVSQDIFLSWEMFGK